MVRNPKKQDENAKSKRWQVPVKLEHVTPEDYPREIRERERPGQSKDKENRNP